MGLQQIRELYLSGKWTKNDLHTLKGFTVKDISVATRGLKRRVKFGEVLTDFSMTVPEVAKLFRVSPLTIRRWSRKGVLPCIRINSRGDRRYLRSEINKLLNITRE